MAALSNYLEKALLEHVLTGVPYLPPSKHFVSLHTSSPTDDPLPNEVSGGQYQRAECRFTPATDGISSNVGTLAFAEMPAVTVTHAGVWDAQVGGNLLYHGILKQTVVVTDEGVFVIKAGELKIGLE